MPLVLSEADVASVMPTRELVDAMRDALTTYSDGGVVQPLRTIFPVGDSGGFFGSMPAYAPARRALATKLVTLYDSNSGRGLPTHLATILVFDDRTGALEAVMDGRFITEARTAAVSAVSYELLRPGGAIEVALIGSGVQAKSHLEMLAAIAPVRRARVWSPTEAHREQFARDQSDRLGLPVEATTSAESAVKGADVVVLATTSTEPVVRNEWVADGAHVISVGACLPHQREMDPDLVVRASLFVDSRVGALAESGDIVQAVEAGRIAPDHIAAELGEVAAGRHPGRHRASEVTVFKSLGMAVEDAVAAKLVSDRAVERGVGRHIEI